MMDKALAGGYGNCRCLVRVGLADLVDAKRRWLLPQLLRQR
jgi:hypothetical protein